MGRRKSKTSSSSARTGGRTAPEYADDGSARMPVTNTQSQIAAARRVGRTLSNRSGRASTRLASDAGTRSYIGSIIGSVL